MFLCCQTRKFSHAKITAFTVLELSRKRKNPDGDPDGNPDGRTDGQPGNIMPLAPSVRRHKNFAHLLELYMFTVYNNGDNIHTPTIVIFFNWGKV